MVGQRLDPTILVARFCGLNRGWKAIFVGLVVLGWILAGLPVPWP